MKALALVVLILSSSSAFANNNISNSEAAVAAEMLARQVIAQNLAPADVVADLKVAIEGPGTGTLHADLNALSCEAGLGSVDCALSITSTPDQKPSASYTLIVKLYQCAVNAAYIQP